MSRVCVFEAKMALFYAALRTSSARDRKDYEAVDLWRRRADYARELLREACDERDAPLVLFREAA